MPTRYLVLRADGPFNESFDPASRSAWRETGRRPAGLSLSVVDGRESDGGQLRADPQNTAVMDADAVFSLISPKARASAAGGALDALLKQTGTLRLPAGLTAIGAHTASSTGQGVRVAVLDTGLDRTHPAFTGRQIAARDFTGTGAAPDDVTDTDGHGTHCAGTICGAAVGDVRVGVAPGVTRLAVGKVLSAKGGTLEMLLKGMFWAVMDERADVVSMSLGFDLPGNVARLVQNGVDPRLAGEAAMRLQNDITKGIATLRAFLESQSKNVVFVAASGNESERDHGFSLGASLPASELLAIGAVGPEGSGDKWKIATFSNGRARAVAPGVDVVSAAPGGGWEVMSGTSMATPHVAGVAALWVQKLRDDGSLGLPDVVRTQLLTSATRRPLVDTDLDAIGAGLVQAPQ
jgi:subtilisin family serine protease